MLVEQNFTPDTTTPNDLLVDLSALYKIQPATAIWRAVEIHEILKEGLPGGVGLDLGCGDGALTGLILKYLPKPPEMIGLDYDPAEIDVARKRGVYTDTVVAGGEDMPLDDNSVDFVFSNSVLEHLPDLDATIGECARVLKPGGTMIATVPEPQFRALLGGPLTPFKRHDAYVDKIDARLAHHNYLDADAWRDLFAKHGMTLTRAKGYLNGRQVRRWERFSNVTAGILQGLGASNALLYRLQRFTRSDDPTANGLLEDTAPAAWRGLWAKCVAGRALAAMDDDRNGEDGNGCLLIKATKPGAVGEAPSG